MTDDELYILMKMNSDRTQFEQNKILEEFWKMDEFIHKKLKENAKHHIFKTKKSCDEAMMKYYNPYSTYEIKK